MRILRYHSPLMTFLTRLADIILLNVLWIVCSLPLITAGAATTALYSCTLNLDEPTEQPVVRRFFRAFGAGFGKSTALFAVWVVAMALVALDVLFYLYIIEDLDTWFRVLFMIPAFILLLISSYLFPLHARFETSLGQLLKNAVSLTIVHLPTTALIAVLNCVPVLLLFLKTDIFLYLLAVWTLFGFSLIAYLNSYFLKKIFRMHLPEETEEGIQDGADISKN